MLNKFVVALLGGAAILPQIALAADNSSRLRGCLRAEERVTAHNGKWIELTPEQWQFIRGIYAMNPQTPAGLPYGDKAVLAQIDGNNGGMIFFIDGDKACTPMPIPGRARLDDQRRRDRSTINHEASGL